MFVMAGLGLLIVFRKYPGNRLTDSVMKNMPNGSCHPDF